MQGAISLLRFILNQGCQILSNASAISAGESATEMPHSRRKAFLLAASPLPPEMIAPACPIRLPGGAVTDPDDLVGLRTVRRIPQGRPLARDLVEELPVVLRGDQVTLTVRAPGLTVTAQGEARQDGAPGSVIPVLNLRSHRTVQGRVVDARTVEVAY